MSGRVLSRLLELEINYEHGLKLTEVKLRKYEKRNLRKMCAKREETGQEK